MSVFAFCRKIVSVIMDHRYRPELHYMRGPGPKTLSKLGDAYRAQTDSDLRERVPEAWLALIQSIRERERKG